MKFGGAAVASAEAFGAIAELVAQRDGPVVVVVSAMGRMTDHLVGLAHRVNPQPPEREMDMLISVGERISTSLLAMALAKRGIGAVSFTGSQSGIITSAEHSEARIERVTPGRLMGPLDAGKVAIVAGFQGVSRDREITTLGRGGSDTTAVALGVALGAEVVEFYKDVDGVYEMDPHRFPEAKLLSNMSFEHALALAKRAEHPFLHPRCIELAKKNGLPLWVRSFRGVGEGTRIGERAAVDTIQFETCALI